MQQNNDQSLVSYCKNHSKEPSRYFVTDQPWVRYCKDCAFNVALCGRNISQDYKGDEFERKMQITSIVNQLRSHCASAKENNGCFQLIAGMLEDGAKPLSDRICQIDRAISELTETRDKLHHLMEKEVVGRVNQFLERQSRMALTCRQAKGELESIQSNFSDLIRNQSREEFQEKMIFWGQLTQATKKEQITEEQFSQTKDRIMEVMEVFYSQLEKLSTFSLNLDTKPFFIGGQDTFSMVLTPVDANSLCASMAIESTNFKKTKRELKLRSAKKNQTERDMTSRKPTKRGSIGGMDTHYASQICRISK